MLQDSALLETTPHVPRLSTSDDNSTVFLPSRPTTQIEKSDDDNEKLIEDTEDGASRNVSPTPASSDDGSNAEKDEEQHQVKVETSATTTPGSGGGGGGPTSTVLDFPDGGLRAWLVVFGCACGTFATFGYVIAWGVFQEYYGSTVLSDTSPSTIAWIGSIQYSLIFIPGLITGRLFDRGHLKVPIFIFSVVLVVSTFVTAQCTRYWHFLLCQGLVSGTASGFLFGPMLNVVAHWFRKKRGAALGIIGMGSSIGGTVFPIAARNLIPIVGFLWTMRILAFIQLFALAISNLTIARRLPAKRTPLLQAKLEVFKYMPYTVYSMSAVMVFLGLYTCLTYIDQSAVSLGIDPNFSFYLVAIANALTAPGRVGGGILADKFGSLNVLIPSTLVAAIMTYAWPFVTTKGQFVAIAVIYGLASGVYVALLPGVVMAMGEAHDVGLRIGYSMSVLALGALAGPPASGAILTVSGGFKAVGYFAGSAIVIAVILMIVTRQLILRRLWGRC